jgi:Phage Tail Collar Domain
LKRAPFLGASAAVVLSGCGGSHVLKALPGVAQSNSAAAVKPRSGSLVPLKADAIPNNVLANPIIGEAWRFDGAAAPSGWMLAQGQSVNVADNPKLFSILGTIAGGDGKTSFKLPNPGYGYVVAVAGWYLSSPQQLARSGRRILLHQDSLGPGAIANPRMIKRSAQRDRAVAESQQLRMSAQIVGPSRYVQISAELESHIASAGASTRETALSQLSANNRVTIESLMDRVALTSISSNDAVVAMMPRLSTGEAGALLETNDGYLRGFRTTWSGNRHENLQLEAARFLVSVAFTPEQRQTFLRHNQ